MVISSCSTCDNDGERETCIIRGLLIFWIVCIPNYLEIKGVKNTLLPLHTFTYTLKLTITWHSSNINVVNRKVRQFPSTLYYNQCNHHKANCIIFGLYNCWWCTQCLLLKTAEAQITLKLRVSKTLFFRFIHSPIHWSWRWKQIEFQLYFPAESTSDLCSLNYCDIPGYIHATCIWNIEIDVHWLFRVNGSMIEVFISEVSRSPWQTHGQ
jgi:hypothetical protein